jgi:hypothetical protein
LEEPVGFALLRDLNPTVAMADAHGLYRQFGFTSLSKPERLMERHDPDIYSRTPS